MNVTAFFNRGLRLKNCCILFTIAILTIEGQIHDENQNLTLKTISQRYKLEKHKKEIEQQKETNRKIKRDIAINAGTEEQYQQRAGN